MAPTQPCAKYQYVLTSAGPKILPVPDAPPKDEESPADYNAGGYLQINLHHSFKDGRYLVVRKLGWGHFSTVWLVKDTHTSRHSALKVVKSAGRYAETARDEIKLLSQVRDESPGHPGRDHVVAFLDSFQHVGPEGVHVCIVCEPLGENLLALIERHKKAGVPPALVKLIARQILLGLEYLHDECDLVHTDIKPENIMISIPDVEAHIQAELSISPSPRSRKVGVPPKNLTRSGMAIPRLATGRDRHVQIFDSQPLASPSPASSAASSPMVRPGLQMSRMVSAQSVHSLLDKKGKGKQGSGSRSELSDSGSSASAGTPPLGPSLLTQTAPHNVAHRSASPHGSGSRSPRASHTRQSSSQSTYRAPSPPPPTPTPSPVAPPMTIKIADLGNATPTHKHYTEDIQTRQYRSPEVIVGRTDWGPTADVWSAACVIFELLAAEYLFDPQSQGGVFGKDDDHMAQVIELLGDFDAEVKFGGRFSRDIFDSSGALRYIRSLKPWPLKRVMVEKYAWAEEDAAALCEFLEPMLVVDHRKRKHARDMKDHPWLAVDMDSEELWKW
ncbi:hypothetical protein POSPLADRAFT_1130179 [Postia placenta MAD-698-R-SB12]|uniref:non-specific serine/threonine protein kinase n=1 Tax=Postia placenta MAD-698-R-SB12 TaxID=670580 RepID=A0A1X6NH66_9APHY|nr:hypothetical protein POSPLADRAFT_1130179 [Postia placenta MAD-698-R-SB12]OSX67959.1 hypothetical protein POSPLADRAFT_1130179 [Postia placenta MAD-698-R-SB12]